MPLTKLLLVGTFFVLAAASDADGTCENGGKCAKESTYQTSQLSAKAHGSAGDEDDALSLLQSARSVSKEKLVIGSKVNPTMLSEVSQHQASVMEPVCVGLKAAAASYRFVANGVHMDADSAKADLETNGYNFVRGYNKSTSYDWDYMGLWRKGGDCVITFMGSSDNADFVNNWNHTPVADFYNLTGVHAGLTVELGGLLDEVDFAAVRERCTGTLMVAGHSLGGGLAQLFAGIINHVADPLNANLHVDKVFTFGAMPVSQDVVSSGSDSDGCFGGSAFFTARHNDDGTDGVDIVANTNVGGTDKSFDPARMTKVLLFSPQEHQEFACGNQLPLSTLTDTGFSLHAIQMYEYFTGCITAAKFYAAMAALMASH